MTPLAALVASRKATLRRLRAVIVLAFAIPLLGLLITAGLMYRQAFEQAHEDLDAAARIAQEHASKLLETNEMLLERMLDLLGTGTDEEWLARGAELHERLKLMTRNLPQVQGFVRVLQEVQCKGVNHPLVGIHQVGAGGFVAGVTPFNEGGFRSVYVGPTNSTSVLH